MDKLYTIQCSVEKATDYILDNLLSECLDIQLVSSLVLVGEGEGS